jgi:hypothetical protein
VRHTELDLSGGPQGQYMPSLDSQWQRALLLSNHIESLHSGSASSVCDPCPLDSLSKCSFPQVPEGYDFMNHLPSSFTQCGVETHNPDDFVNHYKQEHQWVSGFQQTLAESDYLSHLSYLQPKYDDPSSPFTLDMDQPDDPSPATPVSHKMMTAEAKNMPSSPYGNSVISFSQPETPKSVESIMTIPDWDRTCFWRHHATGQECGKKFENSKEVQKHVVDEHVNELKKVNQQYHCGWRDCRRSDPTKQGFPQKSKLIRHLQAHVGCGFDLVIPIPCSKTRG